MFRAQAALNFFDNDVWCRSEPGNAHLNLVERGLRSGLLHPPAQITLRQYSQIVNLYAKRWTIEPGFRDAKDLRFGMGLSVLRIGDPQRRDRLLLLNTLAILLLTLLGAAGESLGMDRSLRTGTVKRRVHSLFRQGCLLYDLIPNMPEQRLRPLLVKYQEFLNKVFTQTRLKHLHFKKPLISQAI